MPSRPVLAAALLNARAVWEHQLELARGRGDDRTVAELEAKVVTLFISYEGDPPDLAAAGIDAGYDSGGMTTAYLPMRDLDRVESLEGVSEVTIQPTLRPTLDTSVKEIKVPWKTPGGGGWPGRGSKVIVAVIDTGIDIFHKSFLRPDGKSRILELWDQSAGLTGGGPPPSPTLPGRIYNNQQLSDAITAGSFESTDTSGHGTHVAGIAAGAMTWGDRCSQPGTYAGVAPDADLVVAKVIGVQGADVVAALNWCAQAGSRHGNKAVVVNCSFGHDTGPHDATDPLDKEFDKVLRPAGGPPRGLVVVCAAGNEGAADIHESGTVQPGGSATVPFYMPVGSNRPDELDIWYDGGTELGVEVIAPSSTTFPPPNTTTQLLPPSNTTKPIGGMLVAVSSTSAQSSHNNRRQINVQISAAPPPTPPPAGSTAPKVDLRPGTWQLVLTHISGPAARYDAWFETSHTDGFPRFRKPDDKPGAEPRRRENTVGSPGSCRNVVTVANYNDREGTLAASSSRGADNQSGTPVAERKPTIAAPGQAVAAARSRLDKSPKNSSCCDQLVVDKSGTSMASPHVAGVVALMLEKHSKLTFEEARAFLQGSARLDGIPTSEVPAEDPVEHIRTNALWGAGKVDARAATDAVPVPAGGGGGGGGGPNPPAPIRFAPEELGYTPHTWASRMSDWRRRFDGHPGVMLLAALVSEHVDEVLWLVNHDRRAIVAWRRGGGHLLVRRLLQSVVVDPVLIPTEVEGHDMRGLLERLTAVLPQVASQRLRDDVVRFGEFAQAWPGATIAQLDAAALRVRGAT